MLSRFNARKLVVFGHDIIMTVLSFMLTVYLRIGDDAWTAQPDYFLSGAITIGVIGAVVYQRTGLYRGIWRYASVRDLAAITRAVSLTLLIFILVMFAWTRLEDLPRSAPFINWFVLMAMLGAPRLAYRVFRDRSFDFTDAPGGKRRIPVLLAGAGDGAEMFIRSLTRSRTSEYSIVGIVSEKSQRIGQQIHGISILGTLDDLPNIIENLSRSGNKPQRLVLTKDTFDGATVRRLFQLTGTLGLTLARVPDVTEFKTSDPDKPDKIEVRSIDVEDLLGRPQTVLDRAAMKALIANKRVLVTGAGGSIGGELVRQILTFGPMEIGLLENSEYALYQIEQNVANSEPSLARRAFITDVRDNVRVEHLFATFKPDLVFHAAALKHVPIVEYNCCEGILTNAIGTMNIADACVRHGVDTMVQISTDKAVNPTNVMGASKRVAEQYCQALDLAQKTPAGTNFVTVRFGNVLGSTGSVVPLFQKQLENGGPLTVTHPDMTRYFMTIREAVELVLVASATAERGEEQNGKIFVLDMGEPVRIIDLAEQMIRLAGLIPGRDIKIEVTGTRPGEKLFEELLLDTEGIVQTDISGLFLAAPRITPIDEIRKKMNELKSLCDQNDEPAVRRLLAKIVPEASLESPQWLPDQSISEHD
ncbi:MAG: polysaccharide biosynthesis protein [Rhodospirillales bacterium]|nr:polysaccharide biosynthesis protein [Rhodospirillales bacterium]